MEKKEIEAILDKYRAGTASEEEIALLESWYLDFTPQETGALGEEERLQTFNQVWSDLESTYIYPKTIKLWPRIAAAASVILALSFGGYFLLHKQRAEQTAYFKNDIPPGHNRATLTLANGEKIILTKGLSGQLAQQANTLIGINSQNTIAYTVAGKNVNKTVDYNTLSTAIGEQSPYPLVLADGTKVWLDAKSSITFPVAFTGKEREVKITGEAYFEVIHDSAHPFKVAVKDQIVEDIGTHFNINAYDDENTVRTTLLEGSVKISVPASSSALMKDGIMLNPGQQSVMNNVTFNIANSDIEKVMAWKNGYFRFNHDKIEDIMRELSRWYNIDVQYSGTRPDEKFYATISRNRNISEVLVMLENTKGVHFKIEGRRVTVMQ